MKYAALGNTDLQVSKICLGTMTFGEQNTEKEAHEQLDYSISQGVNFIDTAEMYPVPGRAETQGSTEQIIGSWIKKRKNRDSFVLATKIAGPAPRFNYIRDPLGFKREQIHQALEQSLRRLQTDYIDLYQLHWPERRTNFFGQRAYKHSASDPWENNFEEVLGILQDLIKEGKIRHIGISNETPWGFSRFLHLAESKGLPRVVSVQNPYSLLNRSYEMGMAEMSIRENAGLLAYSPMAFGMLSGKYHSENPPKDGRLTVYPNMSRYTSENSRKATGEYMAIAQEAGISIAQLSLAFINHQVFLSSTIIGATKMEQLKENIESVDINLSKETLKAIEEVQNRIPNPAP